MSLLIVIKYNFPFILVDACNDLEGNERLCVQRHPLKSWRVLECDESGNGRDTIMNNYLSHPVVLAVAVSVFIFIWSSAAFNRDGLLPTYVQHVIRNNVWSRWRLYCVISFLSHDRNVDFFKKNFPRRQWAQYNTYIWTMKFRLVDYIIATVSLFLIDLYDSTVAAVTKIKVQL